MATFGLSRYAKPSHRYCNLWLHPPKWRGLHRRNKVAKTIAEQVAADVAKAEKERKLNKAQKDYDRWIVLAAKTKDPDDKKRIMGLAAEELKILQKLKK